MIEHGPELPPAFFEANAEKLRQIERVGRGLGEAALRRMSLEQAAFENRLDGYVDWVLINHLPRPDNTMRQLRRSGVHTLRDVLVLGPGRFDTTEGPKNRVMTALKERYPELYDPRFDDPRFKPDAADIARICHSLYQVNANVLKHFYRESERINHLVGHGTKEDLVDEELWHEYIRHREVSVADLLDPNSRAAPLLTTPLANDPEGYEPFAAAREEALRFAEEFYAARQQMS